jgi:hypothetical protein
MIRFFKLAVTVALLCFPMGVSAQYQLVELGDVQLAKSLAATIQDSTGTPVRNAVVEEFSSDWKTVLRTSSTDRDGKFSFTPEAGRKIYFIQVSSPGFDPLRFRLQVDTKHGAVLKVKLTVAT